MAKVKTWKAGSVGDAELDASAFGERHNPVVLREAVLMYEANKRVGTVQTRTRRFVAGASQKLIKQKHTGRARRSDGKAPQFRGGGVAHGPHPRDFSYAMPKKALKQALRVALSSKFRDGEVVRWEGAVTDAPSTKTVRSALDKLGVGNRALFVSEGAVDRNLLLSVRNLPYVSALPAAEMTAYDAVAHDHMILLDGALEALQSRLAEGEGETAIPRADDAGTNGGE